MQSVNNSKNYTFHNNIQDVNNLRTDDGETAEVSEIMRWVSFYFGETFSGKTFQTLSDRIECDGRNRFLPLSFRKESFFYRYKYLLKEVKEDDFGLRGLL